MKKNQGLGRLLNRSEQRLILGGKITPLATCSATCSNGVSVSCTGDNCTASDGFGCSSSNGEAKCPKT